ncbi:MAG: hypothetical protein EOO77_15160 [Oxalobacteraceae bacterium]|nr:MAG: hypothetical protein EOO77_15160 [Oxalobacteraceae bacterium]
MPSDLYAAKTASPGLRNSTKSVSYLGKSCGDFPRLRVLVDAVALRLCLESVETLPLGVIDLHRLDAHGGDVVAHAAVPLTQRGRDCVTDHRQTRTADAVRDAVLVRQRSPSPQVNTNCKHDLRDAFGAKPRQSKVISRGLLQMPENGACIWIPMP